jgi:hypothetical protein
MRSLSSDRSVLVRCVQHLRATLLHHHHNIIININIIDNINNEHYVHVQFRCTGAQCRLFRRFADDELDKVLTRAPDSAQRRVLDGAG